MKKLVLISLLATLVLSGCEAKNADSSEPVSEESTVQSVESSSESVESTSASEVESVSQGSTEDDQNSSSESASYEEGEWDDEGKSSFYAWAEIDQDGKKINIYWSDSEKAGNYKFYDRGNKNKLLGEIKDWVESGDNNFFSIDFNADASKKDIVLGAEKILKDGTIIIAKDVVISADKNGASQESGQNPTQESGQASSQDPTQESSQASGQNPTQESGEEIDLDQFPDIEILMDPEEFD